jgi:hypothetical protein
VPSITDLLRSGLLTFGSRASYQILLRVREDGVTPLTRAIRTEFRDRFVSARSYRSTEDQVSEDLLRAENYLSLVGFVIVVLGGIGVWSVTRACGRRSGASPFEVSGATTRQVLATYVLRWCSIDWQPVRRAAGCAGDSRDPGVADGGVRGVRYGLTYRPSHGAAVGPLVSPPPLVLFLEVRRAGPPLLLRGRTGKRRCGAG